MDWGEHVRSDDYLIHKFETFVDGLNDPRLDARNVIDIVRGQMSIIMWAGVAGLFVAGLGAAQVLRIYKEVLYNNLWVEPASCASRREAGQLDSLFGAS